MSFLSDLVDFLLPERCAGCDAEPVLLCGPCAGLLAGPARPARPAPPGLLLPWTVAAYEGPVRAVFSAYKEHGRTALATPLGEALARSVGAVLAPRAGPHADLAPAETPSRPQNAIPRNGPDPPYPPPPRRSLVAARATGPPAEDETLIVWVPSRRGAARRRGHDPMRRTVAAALRCLRADGVRAVAVDGLRQRRKVADQAGLGATARRANLSGALETVPGVGLAGRRVVLVDDVVTTGASLSEAARALRAAGADVIGAATVAATPRRRAW